MKTLFTNNILILFFTFSVALGSTTLIAQPANDFIANAIDLGYGPIPFSQNGIEFQNATYTGDGTPNPCGIGVAGIWYKFTATAEGIVAAVMVNPNSSIVIFFEGPENATSGAELTHVDQPGNPCDSGSSATLETSPGITYYLYMKNLSSSDVLINAAPAFQAPGNDLIENAIDVNNMEDFNDIDIHFLMATDTNDGGQNDCPTVQANVIWYKFTAEADGPVIAGLNSAPGESGVTFYSALNENATSGSDLTFVNQPYNNCGLSNISSINTIAGTTYYVLALSFAPYATFNIDLSEILGNTENELEGFVYFPNPVTNELHLSAISTIDEVLIYNLMGQKVFSEKPQVGKTKIDLSYLSPGLYVMNITSGETSGSYKIVKE